MGFPKFIFFLSFYLSDNQDREQDPIRVWVRSLIRTQGEKLCPFQWISTIPLSILLLSQVFNSGYYIIT